MTGDNQNSVTPNNTATFGSGLDQKPATDTKPMFGSQDIDRILNQNFHAQNHIKTLESETAALREELKVLREQAEKGGTIDDILNAMKQQDTYQSGPTAPQVDQQELLNTLRTQIFQDLTAAQKAELEERNMQNSIAALRERHGDGFATYVDGRAVELGIPVNKLEELAKTSPKAFMELVSPSKSSAPAPTRGSQALPGNPDADLDAYFMKIQQLRKQNTPEGREAKAMWEDPDVQARYRQHVLDKARRAGSQFGNKL